MAESSSAAPALPKPVVVRVKRKPSQSPLDAFWLEINERPLKRSLLDLGNLTISGSAQKVEFHNKKVFVQHVETISSSEVTFDIVQSFVDPGSSCASILKSKFEERKNFFKRNNKQDQLLVKAKQEKEVCYMSYIYSYLWMCISLDIHNAMPCIISSYILLYYFHLTTPFPKFCMMV
ncbi:RNA-directed DNA methylation 4-like [Vigna umbellata]|uniref:RNA-directed DNA methylation 4-like n=1 Tax=Vigna umbellata TaxID=87088 RepID=UPI001F5FB7DC|nr:RNA-directed DNA methylation 4-like [Vigna umbellata]